jgi:hypothetical protein
MSSGVEQAGRAVSGSASAGLGGVSRPIECRPLVTASVGAESLRRPGAATAASRPSARRGAGARGAERPASGAATSAQPSSTPAKDVVTSASVRRHA